MKTYKKLLWAVVLMVVVVGVFFIVYLVYQRSYYPMGGKVTIIDKFESGADYYIVIEEATGEQFTLSCSESDYNQVSVGNTINCDRNQSTVTHKGNVHKIKPVS